MPVENDPLLDPLKTTAEERFFELAKRRKAFAAQSDDTWIEQPRLTKDNVPLQPALTDTRLQHKPSPKASSTMPSEDDTEF